MTEILALADKAEENRDRALFYASKYVNDEMHKYSNEHDDNYTAFMRLWDHYFRALHLP